MRDILHTVFTRYLIALLNLVLIFINAKVLGVDGVGVVGLILASIGIISVCCGIFSGNTIIYFMNRYSMHAISRPVYGWIPLGAAIACGVLAAFRIFPREYLLEVYLLSVLNAAIAANARFLLGRNKVNQFNITYVLQGGLLFFILLFFYFGLGEQTVGSYVNALFFTWGLAFIISLFMLIPLFRHTEEQTDKPAPAFRVLLKEMWIYGLWGSADNLAENLTTRLNYFLIKYFGGLAGVGLLDAGTKMSECVFHINRSIGFIEYSRVAQTDDVAQQKQLTIRFLKLTFAAVFLATACIAAIPESIYINYLFSPEFTGMKLVIYGLSPGIIAMACHSIISQYFIASGHIRYSAYASFIGLVILIPCGCLLIPRYGIVGSAVSSSLAFCCMFLYSILIFCRKTNAGARDLWIQKADIDYVYDYFSHKRKGLK